MWIKNQGAAVPTTCPEALSEGVLNRSAKRAMSSDSVERNWLPHTRAQVRKLSGWVKRRVAASIGGVRIAKADEVLGRFNGRFAGLAWDRLRRSFPDSHDRLTSIISDVQGFLARMTTTLDQWNREARQGIASASAWIRKNAARSWFALSVLVGRRDTQVAAAAYLFVRLASLLVPEITTRAAIWSIGILVLTGALVLVTVCIVLVSSFLSATADYESLRSHTKPVLWRRFAGKSTHFVETYPFTMVVLYATIAGMVLSLETIPVGVVVRRTLDPVQSLLPSHAGAILTWPFRTLEGALRAVIDSSNSDDDAILERAPLWWTCLMYVVLFFQDAFIIALGAAWLKRFWERHAFALSLVVEPDDRGSPLTEQPRGRVVAERARRIGPACLAHVWSELADPQFQVQSLEADGAERCRCAIAALEEIFEEQNGVLAWREEPVVSLRLLEWMTDHTSGLLRFDARNRYENDHRLAESVVALATMASSAKRSSDGEPGGPSQAAREEACADCDALLNNVFDRSRDRPIVLVAACEAAVRLDTVQSLDLLESLTRDLGQSTTFSASETDKILLAHDRVSKKPDWRRAERHRANELADELELQPLGSDENGFALFLRPKDNAVMVLVPAGSFVRGDTRATNKFLHFQRRVHVDAFLVDREPVSDEAFNRWVTEYPRVLDLDRGFIETRPDYCHWFAACRYAAWVVDGARGCLPTEAQWEKAARGPVGERRFPGGDGREINIFTFISPYGVHIGDRWEWTLDGFDDEAYGNKQNPFPKAGLHNPVLEAAVEGGDRVVRGGPPNRADYSLAQRTGCHPLTGGIERRICFRVVIPFPRMKPGANP